MQNPNALIAMALVSKNANNPYFTFCEYIKYCIFTNSEDTMTLADIRTAVSEEFGLNIPYNIAIECISRLQNEGIISNEDHQFRRTGSFDLEGFERYRSEYHNIETTLINALVQYASDYKRTWSIEYARGLLIKVLDKGGLAYDIFLHKQNSHNSDTQAITGVGEPEEQLPDDEEADTEDTEDQLLFSDEFFVGKFIEKVLSEDTVQKDYLLKICEGLMLCVGTYQLPSADASSASLYIAESDFFFDTRLLLRFIGCAGEAAVEAAGELVKLIQSANGRIYYYPQTLEEMDNAFDEAIDNLSHGYPPRDEEMRLYSVRVKNSITVISAKKANLKDELSKANIYLRQHEDFSDTDRIHFGFDLNDLQQYMKEHLSWERQTIENDALSIWETHMKRQGNYNEYCGTRAHLPVFVTTNSRLIGIALRFHEKYPHVRGISNWKKNRLPVITDIRLTCRLWSPATQSERMSLLYLTANTVAAQRPTQRYFKAIRELAIELGKNTPEYSNIPLPAFFDDNVRDSVLEHTQGVADNLNIGVFASSIAELTEWKVRDQEKITDTVREERDQVSGKLDEQTLAIVEGAVDSNKNRLRWRGLLLKLIFCWPIVAAVLFAGISAIISNQSGNWKFMWITLIPMGLKAIELLSSSNCVIKLLLDKLLPLIEQSYERKIIKKLRKAELPYKDKIIERTMEQTALIVKARKLRKP